MTIPDKSLDWMAETENVETRASYVRPLIDEVMRLQSLNLLLFEACEAFLNAWDADPANVIQMDAAIEKTRTAIGQAVIEQAMGGD